MEVSLDVRLEGILFYKAAPQKRSSLVKLLDCKDEQLTAAVETLKNRLNAGAVRLLETEKELQLVTAPELDQMIETMRKDDLKRDIGKAGAETLAIILYKGPITRVEIDRIRGVNSAFILRNLMTRGLIERSTSGRTHNFDCTPALLAHLGVTARTELPDHAHVLDQIEAFETALAAETE